MKNSKRLLLTTIFLSTLLSLSAYASQVPNAHAAEMTAPEKSLSILKDVVNLNMTAYMPVLRSNETNPFLSSTQEEADFNLMSSIGKLRAACSFIGDHLRQIFISDLSGEPSLNQPSSNALASAKGFLERYQRYTSDSLYGELRSMLNKVNIGENVTKIVGNVKLTVSNVNEEFMDFMWTYIDENGVPAFSKDVVLSYRNGFLKAFLDNWQLYTISAEPKLSSEQAIAVALDAAETYSWTVENTENGTVTVSDFKIVEVGNASLCYLNYRDASVARGGDPFVLYPSWYVPLGFDKVYAGGVSGVTVRVWADTGGVSGIGPMVIGGEASPVELESAVQVQEQALLLTVSTVVVVAVLSSVVYFGNNKIRFLRLKGIRKLFLKLTATLLCLIISFSIVSTIVSPVRSIPTDNATSRIYTSTWGQIDQEEEAAEDVCDMLEYMFSNAGYNTTNHFGSQTTRNTILANTEDDEENFDYVAVFHFGHMNGPNCYMGDNGPNYNDYVDYTDITPLTDGKTFFAWIWTCKSANDWPNSTGMPSAWTDTVGMSPNAYYNPDASSHCYIGFTGASPVIGNDTGGCFSGYPDKAMDFITQFYYYAVTKGTTINDALDLASLSLFSASYNYSPLYQGYSTWWPVNYGPGMGPGWYGGYMRVYGNGGLRFRPTVNVQIGAVCWNGQWFEMTNVRLWVDDFYWGYTNWHWMDIPAIPGNHTIEVDDYDDIYSHLPFACFYVDDEFYDEENPTTVYIPEGTETVVVAIYG